MVRMENLTLNDMAFLIPLILGFIGIINPLMKLNSSLTKLTYEIQNMNKILEKHDDRIERLEEKGR